jgi:pantoate--beta-alanine ligase
LIRRGRELQQSLEAARAAGKRVGLVPTMGALHEGHLSLVRRSREQCDCTAVTIFVNPTQFGPQEDLGRYPRTLDADIEVLANDQVDVVFTPEPDEMYPPGFSTYVQPPQVSLPFEGRCRPGHFRGVATVVLKLFHLAPADIAFFGQKDYQQCLVIQHMARDLDLPVEVRMCPIVRETDGLAMSSRNRYMNEAERQQALALSRGLQVAQQLAAEGERDAAKLADGIRRTLDEAGISRVDYAAIADRESLQEMSRLDRPAVALVAAYVGQTRLIDNCLLDV